MILGTIGGALLGALSFFAVGLQRFAGGDNPVVALGWAVGALLAFIVGGRLVDGLIGAPRPPANADAAELPEPETASPATASDDRGTLVDVAVEDGAGDAEERRRATPSAA
ncbi:MAG: hypothetical protein FJ029_13260 [Actinobacteria bacterium]|nr:hypothetical protein [Actinomycetota bacterium]